MKLKNLVGYKLISATGMEIVVSKDNKKYTLRIVDDYGDCCGYNEIIATFDLKENPVITNVTIERDENVGDGDAARITFFGLNKEIGKIESLSTSGSGWCYGACVTVVCKALKLKETITEY